MRRSIATPCPVAATQSKFLEEAYNEDTTTNFEYTTAFHASFRNVRPKRPQSARRGTSNFAIHEDVDVVDVPEGRSVGEQPQRLSHPAKRVVAQKKAESEIVREQRQTVEIPDSQLAQNHKARRVPVFPKRPSDGSPKLSIDLSQEQQSPSKERGDAGVRTTRRKTLYIPSEDTTQPTMWMGIFSPIKREIDQSSGDAPIELEGIAAQMAEKRRRRASIQPARPVKAKRLPLPLHQNLTAQAQAGDASDRVGAPTGKENLPPGQIVRKRHVLKDSSAEISEKPKIDRDLQRKNFITQARIDKMLQSRKQSSPSSPEIRTMYVIGQANEQNTPERRKRVAWNAGPRAAAKEDSIVQMHRRPDNVIGEIQPTLSPIASVPTRFVPPSLWTVPSHVPRAPVIEHIEHPELYEEDWLGQQEIAITQVLNSMLSQTQATSGRDVSRDTVRSRLLKRYNQDDTRLMYSRVQAATLYGVLSLTHEAIFQIQNLSVDVGRRKLFLKFWIDNYDNDMLKTALEVVSGRQIDVATSRRSSGSSPAKILKRQSLANFVESFILRHEDSSFKTAGSGTTGDLGGKTILKSLMLLKALDLLKEDGDDISKSLLFRKNATFKSSTVAVQNLMQMLNPAVGDSLRALRQLGYTVSHQQDPVEELAYNIENIAVDLRDGVCLTRLVEILLYKSRSSGCKEITNVGCDTVTMSDGCIVSLSAHEDYPLSQHLKVPCQSRAAKMWNVQIALGALRNVKNVAHLIQDIEPEDVVDGYREKTIKLLWTIVGRWGLTGLIDRDDLRKEIKRLGSSSLYQDDLEESHVTNPQVESETLLKKWAEAVASSKGLQIRNFTTSFSDGRIFEAILDEYEPYLVNNQITETASMQKRLARLGCSRQFAELFSERDGQVHIFGKDFVLAALAFLCSRVVGPTKVCRSAVQIQRCWRKHWSKVQQARRAVKRDLAEACAASLSLRYGQAPDDKILTAADLGDVTTEEIAKTEIDQDIWLSL